MNRHGGVSRHKRDGRDLVVNVGHAAEELGQVPDEEDEAPTVTLGGDVNQANNPYSKLFDRPVDKLKYEAQD